MSEEIPYKLIRSSRKTIAIEIKKGQVLIRAPYRATKVQIEEILASYAPRIREKLKKNQEQMEAAADKGLLTAEEIQGLAQEALRVIPERVAYYAPKVGVTYGRITIRNQRTKWGSCSGKGNLNFNCLLMLAPPEVIDSVVVHELCHRREMNHSEAFYREVYRVFPEYDKWNRWLKEHGSELMARMG